jgi:ribonuclease HI
MTKGGYYAVRVGKVPGVYGSWEECSAQVLGFKGSVYKKFGTQGEASAFARPISTTAVMQDTPSHPPVASSRGSLKEALERKPIVRISNAITLGEYDNPGRSSSSSSSSSTPIAASKVCSCGSSTALLESRTQNENCGRFYHRCTNSTCSKFVGWAEETSAAKRERMKRAAQAIASALPTVTGENTPGLLIFTDGACLGNRNVHTIKSPAGWGVCVISSPGFIPVTELFGPVVLDKSSLYYLHTEVGSNNTAELCAIAEGLLWLRDSASLKDISTVSICYDSEYAHKTVVGMFNGEKNRALYMHIRSILTEVDNKLRGFGMQLRWKHVKGHSGDKFNDRADYLAGLGAKGQVCHAGRYAVMSDSATRSDGDVQFLGSKRSIATAHDGLAMLSSSKKRRI